MNIQRLKKSVIKHEGVRYAKYKDHLGNWTIGVGHLIKPDEDFGTVDLTNEQVDKILNVDLNIAINDARHFISENDIAEEAFEIVVEMAFQLGLTRLLGFKNFRKSLQEANYRESAAHMLDSRWAKQTPNRANTLALQMENI